MKRSTAINRLTDVVDGLDRAAAWPETTVAAAFVFGAILDGTDLDRIELALVVAEPAEVVPWMSRPAHLEALAAILRFTKLPLSWRWRPSEWPVWNHEIDRAVRFWAAADGGWDRRVIEALATGRLDDVALEGPASRNELTAELLVERDVGRRHLATVTENFYDQDRRRAHRSDGVHAEDHLWWASRWFWIIAPIALSRQRTDRTLHRR